MLRFLFRPSILIALSAAVVVGAVAVLFQRPPTQGRPTPLPVGDGEREIVWLYPATSAATWQRFVAAVRRTAQRGQPAIQADDRSAFPSETTTVPQVSLTVGAAGTRLVFRWYKLTGDWKTSDWIEALLKRQPPPLAIVGGSNSDSARELAYHLNAAANDLPDPNRPLLLLTTATADRVAPPGSRESDNEDKERRVKLTRLYPGRTFRFCFSNEQMATAVSDFIWRRDDLRPGQDPVFMAMWNDDSYSRDLIDGFQGALRQVIARDVVNLCLGFFPPASAAPMEPRGMRDRANSWEWFTHRAILGSWPPGRSGGIFPLYRYPAESLDLSRAGGFRLDVPPIAQQIASSVGSFSTPNPYEAKAAEETFEAWRNQWQSQQLLIVAGQSQPSRRFLRGLIRGSPALSQRAQIVVATGDAIAFNTVYRDREVAWNIQDLPFPLVFFCHRNPIDADAGFRREARTLGDADNTAETGTEDVLLFSDIVEAVVQMAAATGEMPRASAQEWGERLAAARRAGDRIVIGGEGVRLFEDEGQRCSGTGEHVVLLKPKWNEAGDRILPQARLEVWAWRHRDREHLEDGQIWERRGEPLTVRYNDAAPGGGGQHGE